jgi:hypothetical protein
LGYTDLGRELGHTGDTPMAEATLHGTFERDSLSDEALATIVEQLQKHPAVREIMLPIVTEADFKSAFKCVPEKTASSFSGRGGSSLQDMCRMLRKWASGHPVGNSCRNYDSTTDYRIGGCAFQQVVNQLTAGGRPKPSATHSFFQEHCQIGQ